MPDDLFAMGQWHGEISSNVTFVYGTLDESDLSSFDRNNTPVGAPLSQAARLPLQQATRRLLDLPRKSADIRLHHLAKGRHLLLQTEEVERALPSAWHNETSRRCSTAALCISTTGSAPTSGPSTGNAQEHGSISAKGVQGQWMELCCRKVFLSTITDPTRRHLAWLVQGKRWKIAQNRPEKPPSIF